MIIPSIVVRPAPPADNQPPAYETTKFVIDDQLTMSVRVVASVYRKIVPILAASADQVSW